MNPCIPIRGCVCPPSVCISVCKCNTFIRISETVVFIGTVLLSNYQGRTHRCTPGYSFFLKAPIKISDSELAISELAISTLAILKLATPMVTISDLRFLPKKLMVVGGWWCYWW